MLRYFAFVFLTNIAAVFLYQRFKQINLSKTIIIYIAGFSLLMSSMFPFLFTWLNLFQIIFLYVFATLFAGLVLVNVDSPSLESFMGRLFNTGWLQKGWTDFVEFLGKSFDRLKVPGVETPVQMPSEQELSEVAAARLDERTEFLPPNSSTETEDVNFYIDKGFEAKINRDLIQALMYFQKALGLSPPIDLMILLVFDINAMYKELGRYQEAKEILRYFLKTHGQVLSNDIRRDVQTSIAYLDILLDLLKETNTPNLPITSIPISVKAAADNRLAELPNL